MSALIPYKAAGLVLLSALFISACATTPTADPRATALQAKLETLENNSERASRGGEELKTARAAVQLAVKPAKRSTDQEIAYRFYVADRLVETAEMRARARLAEDRSKNLIKEYEKLVLEARTLEANRARQQVTQANQSAAEALALRNRALQEAAEAQTLRDEAQLAQSVAKEGQRSAETATEVARNEADKARLAAAAEAEMARAEMESLRGRLSELEAKQTKRGLLITLGDVLFEFNKSELKPGGKRNLLTLAEALKERADQPVIIEGHTDSIGNHAYNMTLSEKRAVAVEQYLVDQGVNFNRINTEGMGPDFPVADNATNEGRQLNRRVEVILPNLN